MDRDMMMETYIQRTSLSEEGLRRGDVSLTIRNVSLEDNGRFRCFLPSLMRAREVQLVVDPNFVKMTTTETVPHRTLITPTPQDETISTGDRSRLLLFPQTEETFWNLCDSDIPSERCALELTCVVDRKSAESDSTQQLKPQGDAGEDLSPPDESGSSCGCSQTLQESPKPSDQYSITAPGFTTMKRTSDFSPEKKPELMKTVRGFLLPPQLFSSLRMK
ncbi:hypothetical protein CRENBAI_005075 [Crenichthys baileyi]|uniref:Uncharacterized protein n=1 Tax=Crenichthys baileyi TaxID=28760 RepID=A0AAV9QQZ7_9TELE